MRVFEMAICDDEEYWIEDICGYLKAFMSEEEVELHLYCYIWQSISRHYLLN